MRQLRQLGLRIREAIRNEERWQINFSIDNLREVFHRDQVHKRSHNIRSNNHVLIINYKEYVRAITPHTYMM